MLLECKKTDNIGEIFQKGNKMCTFSQLSFYSTYSTIKRDLFWMF